MRLTCATRSNPATSSSAVPTTTPAEIFLNRLAYLYFIPVIDMGLAMAVAKPPAVGMADVSARVTTILPPETCLLCRDAVDSELAREEDLRRRNPAEYDRQKREAYVRGEGNPNPAVVTFTTEVACMAVNELLNRIVSYRKREMGSEHRRRFLFCEDRATCAKFHPGDIDFERAVLPGANVSSGQ